MFSDLYSCQTSDNVDILTEDVILSTCLFCGLSGLLEIYWDLMTRALGTF